MSSQQPNILLITTDQQRYDTLGLRKPDFLRTPHLDHLSQEGISFSAAYADCPICVPSRMSIMSGQYVTTHGTTNNRSSTETLAGRTTLPMAMQALGYQTAAIGKMHFTPQRARHGFEEMIIPDDYYREMRSSGSPLQPMHHGLGQNELYPGLSTVPEAMTLTSWTVDKCSEYILERRDPTKPFFLWCSFSKPHPPLDPPEPYYSMYRDDPIPEPVRGDWSEPGRLPPAIERFWQTRSYDLLPPSVIRGARQAYYGLITHIDYAIGRLFASLQDIGLFQDTMILFTSDHGEYLGDHGGGSKVFAHEASAHVPFVLRLPKSWENRLHGTTCHVPVTLADIYPTLVAAAGGEPPTDTDGIELLEAARQGSDPRRNHIVVLSSGTSDTPEIPDHVSITDGKWKYCWYPEGAMEQLFDLESDPDERHDIAGDKSFDAQRKNLRQVLIDDVRSRPITWLQDGELPAIDRQMETETDRRNRGWPGYHTASHPVDVRH